MARSRTVVPVTGSSFVLQRVTKYQPEQRTDDGKIVTQRERSRGAIIGNVGQIIRSYRGHDKTDDSKSGTVTLTRADLLALFESAGTPSLADRFPEHGEPTVESDPEVSAAFASWLAGQDSIVIGDDEAAAVAAL